MIIAFTGVGTASDLDEPGQSSAAVAGAYVLDPLATGMRGALFAPAYQVITGSGP